MKRRTSYTANKKATTPIISVILSIILILIGGLIGYGSSTDWSFKKSIKGESQAQKFSGIVYDNAGNVLSNDEAYAMPTGILYYADVPQEEVDRLDYADPYVILSVESDFKYNNLPIIWTATYPNGTSASDVLNIQPQNYTCSVIKVTCTKAFFEQITLTAEVPATYPNQTATCTIDYLRRPTAFEAISFISDDFGEPFGIQMKPAPATGTINGNFRAKNLLVYTDWVFYSGVQEYLTFDINFKSFKLDNVDFVQESDGMYYAKPDLNWEYSMFIENFDSFDEEHKQAIYYAWYTAYCDPFEQLDQGEHAFLNIEVEMVYNDTVITTICAPNKTELEKDYAYNLTGANYGANLTPHITLNKTNAAL